MSDDDMVDTLAPFNDIRVRQALQQAVNLPEIAANYYLGTTISVPSDMTSVYFKGVRLGRTPNGRHLYRQINF